MNQPDPTPSSKPDYFLQTAQSVLNWIQKNKLPVFAVALVLILAQVGYTGWNYYQDSLDEQSETDLFSVERKLDKILSKLPKKTPKTKSVFNKKIKDVASAYEAVILTAGSARVAGVHALKLAELYNEYGQTQDSIRLLKHIGEKLSGSDTVFPLVYLRWATILMDLNNSSEALKVLDQLIAQGPKHLLPLVHVQRALCLAKQDQLKEAQNIYQMVIKDHPDSVAARDARTYLRLLMIRQKGS